MASESEKARRRYSLWVVSIIWIFRLTESHGRQEWMSAVERFVVACVIAPIHILNFPLAAAALGGPVAVRMTLLQLLLSLAVFDVLFYSWQQLPFTCSYMRPFEMAALH